jgi:hypothetical protein
MADFRREGTKGVIAKVVPIAQGMPTFGVL